MENSYHSRDRDRDSDGDSRGGGGFRRRTKPRPAKDLKFDYKDAETLKAFVSESGKIVPRRVSRLSAEQQRQLTRAVKRARQASIMPFSRG
jgi:small subunit ribosomal protein S18